jgi:hypothetical protein
MGELSFLAKTPAYHHDIHAPPIVNSFEWAPRLAPQLPMQKYKEFFNFTNKKAWLPPPCELLTNFIPF